MDNNYPDIDAILSEGETVELAVKPNRVRATLMAIIASMTLLLFAAGFLVIGILGKAGVITFKDSATGEVDPSGPTWMIVIGAIVAGFWVISAVTTLLRYRSLLYVLTNRRLILRSGIIGLDYASLELTYVQSMNVRVDLLDKLVRPNTGNIVFSSSALPMNTNSSRNGGSAPFAFNYVSDPYGLFKRLQTAVDEAKGQTKR